MFDPNDYHRLINRIGSYSNLIILRNIWTAVDNIMNRSVGEFKNNYIELSKKLSLEIKENYLNSSQGFESADIYSLGLTDSLLLEWIKDKRYTLISIDSTLCDVVKIYDLNVIDMVKEKNDDLFHAK